MGRRQIKGPIYGSFSVSHTEQQQQKPQKQQQWYYYYQPAPHRCPALQQLVITSSTALDPAQQQGQACPTALARSSHVSHAQSPAIQGPASALFTNT
jgi:hypothetical protein